MAKKCAESILIMISSFHNNIREKCRRSKVQFLMVSHRPEMQEYASRIVGFYVCSNIPQVFSAGFDIDGTKAETERKLRALEYELEK